VSGTYELLTQTMGNVLMFGKKKIQTFRNKFSLYVCVLCMTLVRCQYNEYKY